MAALHLQRRCFGGRRCGCFLTKYQPTIYYEILFSYPFSPLGGLVRRELLDDHDRETGADYGFRNDAPDIL